LVGKTLTPDEDEELEKLEQEYWDALAASKLWPPEIPDPNRKDLPPEQHWHPRGLADLYTGPNRDEVKPDDMEWLFHSRLQVPPGWWESMERLRQTAQRRAKAVGAADGEGQGPPAPRRRTEDEEHAAVVIARINTDFRRFQEALPSPTTPEQESANGFRLLRFYLKHVLPYNADLEMSRQLAAKGVEPPFFSQPAWERLAHSVGTDPNGTHHEIFQAAMVWAQREGNLARVRQIAISDLPALPAAPPSAGLAGPGSQIDPGATPSTSTEKVSPQMHPLQQLYLRAERIISSAADAYRQNSMDRTYWDEFGPNGSARQKAVYDYFRALGDAALQRITSADQWGKLGTTTRELDELIREIAWHLGQAAGVSFPAVDDDRPNLDSLYADTVQGLTSRAWAFLERLRPFVTCLSALCNSPAPAGGTHSMQVEHPRDPSDQREAQSPVPGHDIATRPTSPEPDPEALALAMQAVVEEMKLAIRARVSPVDNGRRVVRYRDLSAAAVSKGFPLAAVEWAIHRHREAGRISVTPGQAAVPAVIDSGSVSGPIPPGSRSAHRQDSFLRPESTLFEWWYKPRLPGRVFPSPYHNLADVLNELFWMAALANRHGWGFDPSQVNPMTNPWEPADVEARQESVGRGIPFASFDPVLTDGFAGLRRLVQVASGNRGVPFSASETSVSELVRRLRDLGTTYARAIAHDALGPARAHATATDQKPTVKRKRGNRPHAESKDERRRKKGNLYAIIRQQKQVGEGDKALAERLRQSADYVRLAKEAGIERITGDVVKAALEAGRRSSTK
jgi:hypothetical protein